MAFITGNGLKTLGRGRRPTAVLPLQWRRTSTPSRLPSTWQTGSDPFASPLVNDRSPEMSVKVRIPTQLRPLAGRRRRGRGRGGHGRRCTEGPRRFHPGFAERLFDDTGNLRRFVNVFVGEEDIRFLEGLGTPVPAGAVVSVVPAVAGGQ